MKQRNNRKGFSLPMSVLFMLVVIMLTLVLVTAALAAAKQVHKEKLQKQAELHVTSTAEVVADLILGMTFHMEVQNPGETIVMTVKKNNGNKEMALQIANLIALAENAATKKSTSGLLSFEMGTMKIEGNVVVYSTKSDFFPGDMVISLTDKSASTTGYTLAFRLDGQVDTSSGEYSFSDMTFYSGSEVYK